jgi:hypothetical protein
MSGNGLPTLQFDQLNVIAHHLNAMLHDDKPDNDTTWKDPLQWPPVTDDMVIVTVRKGIALPKLTLKRLLDSPECPKFKGSKWVQLNKYNKKGMFGKPCPRPPGADVVVLYWVWSYLYKVDLISLKDVEKSRGKCNRGPQAPDMVKSLP